MKQEAIIEHFRSKGALLEGHFLLSSGLHSREYLQCALALRNPRDAEMFARGIVEKLSEHGYLKDVKTVASPAIGGLVIGYAVAAVLGADFIWTERQAGEMTLRRGFSLNNKEPVLVVEDVITTGLSTRECIAALENADGKVVAAASIIDRSNGAADVGVPRIALVEMGVPSYNADACPMCSEGSEAVKPGSRT